MTTVQDLQDNKKFQLIQSSEDFRALLESLGCPKKIINDEISNYGLAQYDNKGNLFAVWSTCGIPYLDNEVSLIWSEYEYSKQLEKRSKRKLDKIRRQLAQ